MSKKKSVNANRAFLVFCVTHSITYGLIILTMIYGWGLWPKSWAAVIIGYVLVSLAYPLILHGSRNFIKALENNP